MKRCRIAIAVAVAFGLLATVVLCDPIYRLGLRLSWSELPPFAGSGWESGLSSLPFDDPVSMTAEEIHEKHFPRSGDRLIEQRRVPVLSAIGGFHLCPAMLVMHNGQRWIYLFYRRDDAWIMKMFAP